MTRLVVLNAVDDERRGADPRAHTEVVSARRHDGRGSCNAATAAPARRNLAAGLVNAAGPVPK